MSTKALLIGSTSGAAASGQGQWHVYDKITSFIEGIKAGVLKEGETLDVKKVETLISGMPTPWARAKLFGLAFKPVTDSKNNNTVITKYYEQLIEEWRGLITLLALYADTDRIKISEPVEMDTNAGVYDITAAFGRMLFDDRSLWCDQDALEKDKNAQPFIHLIYYKGKLVGGTSPYTGVFTGVCYDKLDSTDISAWYKDGKFQDPTKHLNSDQLQKLYLFVLNLSENVESFVNKIYGTDGETRKVALNNFIEQLKIWKKEIENKGSNLQDNGPIAKLSGLSVPFSLLFKSDVPVYLKTDGSFSFSFENGAEKLNDIQEILNDSDWVLGWTENSDEMNKLSDAPVYYLKVNNIEDNSSAYFTVPLSQKGISIFRNCLSSVLGYNVDGKSKIIGRISDDGEVLVVSMNIEIDGRQVALNQKEYKIDWVQDLGKVVVWPNFMSSAWNKYYLYSEFTHLAHEQFDPFFFDLTNNDRIVKDRLGGFLTARYQYSPSEPKPVNIDKLVEYPTNCSEDKPKYNIWCSDKPFGGLVTYTKDNGKEKNAGYMIIRHDKVKDFSNDAIMDSAEVGIDFGSNNTCIYYKRSSQNDPKPVQFLNFRTVLVGKENENPRSNANADELFFFTNFSAENGQFKSWLHEHDSQFVSNNTAAEIAGGVPVNRPNVQVVDMDEYAITTQVGKLNYNMKWLNDDAGLNKKGAFLKSLWLQTCAFLYINKITPNKLYWSYPGAMMESDINNLDKRLESLTKILPISNVKVSLEDPNTEAEAVCKYALSQNFGLSNDNIFLGIDVGGSTSDILLIAKDPTDGNRETLLNESSVRLAAGVFFGAVKNSDSFRNALVKYHESAVNKNVFVSDIKEVVGNAGKAPYFLNCIFDQLKPEDYDQFYDSIANNSKQIFAIPAYVTGLLLFYSGMLIGNVVKEKNLDRISRVTVMAFGKGGRLFHWLNAISSRSMKKYYQNCLNAGAEIISGKSFDVTYEDSIADRCKTEVAYGLCLHERFKSTDDNVLKSDICGETGVKYLSESNEEISIETASRLDAKYFEELSRLDFTGTSNFEKFVSIFIKYVSEETDIYRSAETVLRSDIASLRDDIANFIKRDDEYKKAESQKRNGGAFAFHQPIIIAEGAAFLRKFIDKVFG